MPFLHGVETNFVANAAKPYSAPDTANIALVGLAPTGPLNELVEITSARQALQVFGPELDGFTIPYTLRHIFEQGVNTGARVLVVNIFDPAVHALSVVDEDVTITDGAGQLEYSPTDTPVLSLAGGGVLTTGTDYEIDEYGVIRVLDGTVIGDGQTVVASYTRIDRSLVTEAHVNGTADPRTGLELLDSAQSTLGRKPNIIVVPELGQTDTIVAKMAAKAAQFGALYLVDAPSDATVATVKTGRTATGTIPGFRSADKNAVLYFPYVDTRDARGNLVSRPLSAFAAGVFPRVDARVGVDGGIQKSPSNEILYGVLGPTQSISSSYNDFNADTNQLNEVGVTTIFDGSIRGTLLWGNRNASSTPTAPNTEADVFIAVQRVKHFIEAALDENNIRYLDRPITSGLIDAIAESGSAFLRDLESDGVILGGSVQFDPATSDADLANGIVRFLVDFLPPTPAERIVFTLALNPAYLDTLRTAA